jgi:hypothetical protein
VLRIAVSLVFTVSLAAQSPNIVLNPSAPTSATPIVAEVYVACDPLSHTFERFGDLIRIEVKTGPREAICDPAIGSRYPVPLGILPVGVYVMYVRTDIRDSVETRSFVVRNDARGAFEIHPFAVPTETLGLPLRLDAGELGVAKIFVDNVQVLPSLVTYHDDAYWFPAPGRRPGLVDVKIETDSGATHTSAGALYYYDHILPLDTSVFERILFPVLFHTPGAHGSEWVSEAAIANPGPWPVETYNDVVPFECIDSPCGERLAPRSSLAFSGAGYPHGVALIAPRAESEGLAFSLRVRDTSRAAEGYGTQLPVVREKDMFRNTDLTLLDVPVDPLYRTKVRIYAFDSVDHEAEVTVHRKSAPNVVSARYSIPLRRECVPVECTGTPWYAELDLPVSEETDGRVNVYITLGRPASPAWAFASITNNETQQVTIVTADGEGGRP